MEATLLDWARREFAVSSPEMQPSSNIPIFMPWLNGERSLEWNPDLKPEWHGRQAGSRTSDYCSRCNGRCGFQLAQYVEVVENASEPRGQIVLSGNGFLDPVVAPMLAALVSRETLYIRNSLALAPEGSCRHRMARAWPRRVAGCRRAVVSRRSRRRVE